MRPFETIRDVGSEVQVQVQVWEKHVLRLRRKSVKDLQAEVAGPAGESEIHH